jgi:hypothetical protein
MTAENWTREMLETVQGRIKNICLQPKTYANFFRNTTQLSSRIEPNVA